MIKRFGLGLVVMMIMIALPMPILYAQDAVDPDEPTSSEPSAGTVEDKFTIDEADAADFQKRLEERLEARRNALKQKVSAVQQARIKLKCEAAQTKLSEIAQKTGEAKTSRSDIYNKILTRLETLQTRLSDKGYDVTKLEVSITELENLVNTFNTDLQSLRQAATDVSEMNCKDSPVGFKASLDELRTAREKLQTDSEAIRNHIKDDIKPILQELHTSTGDMKQQRQGDATAEEGSN